MEIYDTLQTFLSSVNPWWDDPKFRYKTIERTRYAHKVTPSTKNRLIRVLIGARRVGKTSILQNGINTLLKDIDPMHIIYLPADFREIKQNGIYSTLEFLAKNFNFDLFTTKLHVFIDEVQELKRWQEDLKILYDHTQIQFYITGSSSLILRKETSKLTGRFLLHHVLPLDFNEFKEFRKKSAYIKKDVSIIEDYLQTGGYPEFVLSRDKLYLKQAIESTLYRELLDYFGIQNPAILNDLLELLADKITVPVSANRISKDLKIDDKTAKFYLEYLKSVYLIYPVYKFGASQKITKSSVPKYYFNDTGVLNLYGIRTRVGHLTENAVFLKLLQEQSSEEIPRIFYDVINDTEIDFRVKQNLYEVKSFENLTTERVAPYELIDNKISLIYKKNKDNSRKSLPYLNNVTYLELEDFLKNE